MRHFYGFVGLPNQWADDNEFNVNDRFFEDKEYVDYYFDNFFEMDKIFGHENSAFGTRGLPVGHPNRTSKSFNRYNERFGPAIVRVIKKDDLTENIHRLKELMGIIREQDEDRIAVLIDGTSSAGKSKTSQMLNAVPFYEATDKNQWVQIDSDMFGCEDEQCIENRMKYDHAGDGPNPDAGEQFHKEMADKRKNHTYGSERGQTTVGFHLHPHNKDLIQGVDSRNWYMAQEYKHGGWKKVIFDDIDKGIKQYIPEVKHILLHAPIYILLQNIVGRPEDDPRDPKEVLGQYLEKYEATKEMPSENMGDPSTILTKKGLEIYEHFKNKQ